MLVSASIPNLVNGVSQQAYTQRLASQASEQVNFLSSITEGLTRRPPSRHKAKLANAPWGDAALHLIDRDQAERYVVAIAGGDLIVRDLDGAARTVAFPNGKAYLASAAPGAAFRAVTVADYTFIVNREVATAMRSATTASRPKEALINIRQGLYAKTYAIEIDGVEVASRTTSSTSGTDIDTSNIAKELVNDLIRRDATPGADTAIENTVAAGNASSLYAKGDAGSELSGYTVTRHQSAIHLAKTSGDFAIAVEDGFNGVAMTVAKDRLQRFSDLPTHGPDGFHVEIIGDQTTAFDNYYVRFEKSDAADSAGVWRETVAQGAPYQLDPATMPHVLVREADGSFTFREAAWADRSVGDTASAPEPSFVGRRLSDVFFFRNRLGFLADENVILSRAGDYFAFWPRTVTAQLESDPIDIAGAHNKVSILRHATPFNRRLLMFAEQSQFELDGGSTLTPMTAAIRPTTEFVTSPRAKPVAAGRHVYFVTEKGGFAGVREYAFDEISAAPDAAENTKHAPAYIPEGVFSMTSARHDDLLALLTTGAPNALFLYKYYWSRDDKLQSSWSRWEFAAGDRLLAAEFIDARLILVIERADGVYLEEMDLDPGAADAGLGYQVAADRRIEESACTVAVTTGADGTQTRLTLPYVESAPLWVVARESAGGLVAGETLEHTRPDAGAIALPGDLSAAKLFIGRRYQSRYLFSPFVLREGAGGAQAAVGEGRLQVLYLALFYEETGGFEVQVTPKARDPYRYAFTGKILGAEANRIGQSALETGRFKLPVYARNTEVAIEIQTESFLPARFIAAEWEGRWVNRARRMG